MSIAQFLGKRGFTITGSRTIATTAGFTSRQFINYHHKGVRLVIDRSDETGTATLDAKVQFKNATTGDWVDLEGAAFPQWADGSEETRSLVIYPGITGSDADASLALDTDNDTLCGQYLPRIWRLVLTTTGTTNVVSIYAEYLP